MLGFFLNRLASACEATLNVAMLGPYLAPHETRMCFCPHLNERKDLFCDLVDVENKNSIWNAVLGKVTFTSNAVLRKKVTNCVT